MKPPIKLSASKNPQEFIPTRQSLLSRLKNHDDSQSWDDFFNTYWRLIYSVAIKAGLTDTEAQEVVQETVIAVSKKMPDFKYDPELGSFKAWLMNQTRWRIKDQFRRRQRDAKAFQPAAEDEEGTPEIEHFADPAGPDLEAVWDAEWQQNLVDTAIERVRPHVSAKQYQIFDLYVNKDWPVEKVQQALGVSASQVYLAKHRISDLIKKEIQSLETKLM